MKRLTLICVSIFLLTNLIYPQDIINETGKDGKFIVRDAEQQEILIIKDSNVEIKGTLSIDSLTQGSEDNKVVVWSETDKQFKALYNLIPKSTINANVMAADSWTESSGDVYRASGNVGIGTSSPLYPVTVYRSGANASVVTSRDGGAMNYINATASHGTFGTVNNYVTRIAQNAQIKIFLDKDSNGLYFGSTGNITAAGDDDIDMTIDTDGNVGIGDITPTHLLDVAGKVGINDIQVLYLPDQGFYEGSIIFGDGGHNLSHPADWDGEANTAVGIAALRDNTIGNSNTFVGYTAGAKNTEGDENTYVGGWAGEYNLIGNRNTFMGNAAGQANTADNNVFIGHFCGGLNTTGNNNVSVGTYANMQNREGSNNTMIGYGAGYTDSFINRSGSVYIGNLAGRFETANNKLYIENSDSATPLIGGDFSTDDVVINGNLEVTGTLKDIDGQAGSAGQILSSTGIGTDWIAATSGADNLGNHTATQDLDMAGFEVNLNGGYLSGDGDAEGVYINTDGIVDFNNQSRARAWLSSVQSIPIAAWTQVEFGSESYDQQMEFTGSSGTGNSGYFTAKQNGYYQINGRTEFDYIEQPTLQTSGYVSIGIFINSNIRSQGNKLQMVLNNVPSWSNNAPNVSDLVYLQTGDIVEIYVWQNVNSPNAPIMSGISKTYFSIHKVS